MNLEGSTGQSTGQVADRGVTRPAHARLTGRTDRIDHLDDVPKQVLEIASVIGRMVSLPILERVAALPHDELSEAIWHLRQAELLYDLPPYERGLHAFRHPLIQEVAYRSLLHERRRDIHGLVARAMETLFKDQADEQAGLLAYHLEQAGETIKAAQQHVRAATWVGANDPAQALRSWKKVRELLLEQPASTTTSYLRMMACGQIVNFAWREGIPASDAKVFFEEASQLAAVGRVAYARRPAPPPLVWCRWKPCLTWRTTASTARPRASFP